MKVMKDSYFMLYPCCTLVKGYKKAAICDLQRNDIYQIPLSLYSLFNLTDNHIDISKLYAKFGRQPEEWSTLSQYLVFLRENDLGIFYDKQIQFNKIDTSILFEPRFITNCIIDVTPESKHPWQRMAEQLNEIRCESLALRYFGEFSTDEIVEHLLFLNDSVLRSIEIQKKALSSKKDELKSIESFRNANFRLTKVFLFSCKRNASILNDDFTVLFSKENIIDASSCGCISDYYCSAQTQSYIEALHYNTCLYKKIAIDINGNIKNCPSMGMSFGNINEKIDLKDIAKLPEFQKLGMIKKDDIEVCCDCELRYVCQDCRAYIKDCNNIYSKPLKCNYNPHEE